jgi:hydrogenase expression/formation protein HypE
VEHGRRPREVGDHRIQPRDVLIASGPLADHGATVLACHHDLDPGPLRSDSAALNHLAEALFEGGDDVETLRDATRRGGWTADISHTWRPPRARPGARSWR